MIFGIILVALFLLFSITFIFDWRTWVQFLSGALLLLAGVFFLVLPNFVRARTSNGSPAGWCWHNMRQIQGAKEQVVLERAYKGPEPTASEIARYIKGETIPKCPGGGIYRLGTIQEKPSCSKHGALSN